LHTKQLQEVRVMVSLGWQTVVMQAFMVAEGKEGRRRCMNPLYPTLVAGTPRMSAPALVLVVRMLAVALVRVQVEVQVRPQRVSHSKVVRKASQEVLKDSRVVRKDSRAVRKDSRVVRKDSRVVLKASKVASTDYKAAPKDSKVVFMDIKAAFTVRVLAMIPSRPRRRCRGAAEGSILRTLGLPLGTIGSKIKRRPLLVNQSCSHRASHTAPLLAPAALALMAALPLLTGICRPSRMK